MRGWLGPSSPVAALLREDQITTSCIQTYHLSLTVLNVPHSAHRMEGPARVRRTRTESCLQAGIDTITAWLRRDADGDCSSVSCDIDSVTGG